MAQFSFPCDGNHAPRGQRGYRSDWKVGEVDGKDVLVVVSSFHRPGEFASRIYNVAVERSPGYSVESSMLMDNHLVAREPIGRYSAKALKAFHEKSVAAVLAIQDEPVIQRYLSAQCAAV